MWPRKARRIAVLSDAFGRITDRITAPVAGRISTIATDPRRDRGGIRCARIIYHTVRCARNARNGMLIGVLKPQRHPRYRRDAHAGLAQR
jgi:hypothetical protein